MTLSLPSASMARGCLSSFGFPGYSMEFHDYKRFGKQMIARRFQDDPESGTELVANVVLLEELKNPDALMFTIEKPDFSRAKIAVAACESGDH